MDAWLGGSELPYEMEILTEFQQLNEKIMTGLRTKKGISLHQTDKTIEGFSIAENVFESLLVKIKGFEHNGWCLWQKDRLLLTGKGRLYADFISSELFL
jgi:oxygen-independent coproporphyrinogen-3 oxidase